MFYSAHIPRGEGVTFTALHHTAEGQNWRYHCVAPRRPVSPPSIASEQQAGATGSVTRVHQIASMAVSSSVYLSKLCGCHPASQAAIAWPPPLPYQDNELHLGPL